MEARAVDLCNMMDHRQPLAPPDLPCNLSYPRVSMVQQSPKEKEGMGDVRNWEELFERYSPAVFGYLYGMSGDRHLAEDLTSETFYRAMRALDGFRGDSSLKTWLIRIARNLYLNRKRRDDKSQSLDDLEDRGVTTAARELDPETRFIREEESEAIRCALRALAEDDRSILLLSAEDELSCREIADVLEISLTAVKTRLFRARRRLAGLLEKG